jgi:hypothetical protein
VENLSFPVSEKTNYPDGMRRPVSFPLRLARVDHWERIASRRSPSFSWKDLADLWRSNSNVVSDFPTNVQLTGGQISTEDNF